MEELKVFFGVRVSHVNKDEAAEKAGIVADDIIQQFNGEKINDAEGLIEAVYEAKPGSQVKIGIIRKGKPQELTATLGERSEQGRWFNLRKLRDFRGPFIFRHRAGFLGLELTELNEGLAEYFAVKPEEGVLISAVVKESPAAKAGLRAGDVILQVGKDKVAHGEDVREALGAVKQDEQVEITVLRHGKKMVFQAKPEFRHGMGHMMVFDDGELVIPPLPDLPELPDIDARLPDAQEMSCFRHGEGFCRQLRENMRHLRIRIAKEVKKIREDFSI
jgi:membrane-associated protease RseP (regulator of RpoE activity)